MLYKINGFSYDDSNGLIKKENEEFSLTKIQKNLFNYFLLNPYKTISKQTLMDEVWERVVTENSIEKTLSKLRGVIEDDPLNPKILVTHFGHGISFEGKIQSTPAKEAIKKEVVEKTEVKKIKPHLFVYLLLIIITAFLVWKFYPSNATPTNQVQSLKKHQKLIILPMTFDEISQNNADKNGAFEYLKSFFNNLDNQGSILFDENSQNSKEAMEKLFQIDKELVMMQTNVVKNQEVFDAVIEFTKGMNSIKTVKISANSMAELAQSQIDVVTGFHTGVATDLNLEAQTDSDDNKYLQALSLVKNKQLTQAKELINTLLKNEDNNYQARFLLSRVYYLQKEYEPSLVQLQTLKQTNFYKDHSAEVELLAVDNLMNQSKEGEVIDLITQYLSQHIDISDVKKSKILLKLAQAHEKTGNNIEGLKLYKQAILKIDEKLYPTLFADSFWGQARIASLESIDETIYSLYDQALEYSKQGGDFLQQSQILNSMSVLLFHNNNWERGFNLKKESLELLELVGDKKELASGLSVLANYLLNRGLFDETREVLNRLKKIADELNDSGLLMAYNHYNISLEMNFFRHDYCQIEIDKQFKLARETKNKGIELNTTFLQMELLLVTKQPDIFLSKWNQLNNLFEEPGLKRYRIYMDNYLARYYHEISEDEKAIEIIGKVSQSAKKSNDFRFLIFAQNTLAQVYMKTDPQKALEILLNLEQYDPNPNPHLELKAIALNLLGRKTEALSVIIEAKQVFNDAWKAENQALLELLQNN